MNIDYCKQETPIRAVVVVGNIRIVIDAGQTKERGCIDIKSFLTSKDRPGQDTPWEEVHIPLPYTPPPA